MNTNIMVLIQEINLEEYVNSGTHWIKTYVKNNVKIYFCSFGVENIPKEIQKFVANKINKENNYIIKKCYSNNVDTFV